LAQALGFERETAPNLLTALGPLSPNEQKVIECLRDEPLPRDELIRQISLPVSEINSLLAVLELKGAIRETLGEIRLM
jgi:predicted Rossmann fold nucleotide-binding protein DprA/Smf involved in DNA uptake